MYSSHLKLKLLNCCVFSLNIVNQYKQSEDVIQNNDDVNTLILNSQQYQPVTDLHIQLENR